MAKNVNVWKGRWTFLDLFWCKQQSIGCWQSNYNNIAVFSCWTAFRASKYAYLSFLQVLHSLLHHHRYCNDKRIQGKFITCIPSLGVTNTVKLCTFQSFQPFCVSIITNGYYWKIHFMFHFKSSDDRLTSHAIQSFLYTKHLPEGKHFANLLIIPYTKMAAYSAVVFRFLCAT